MSLSEVTGKLFVRIRSCAANLVIEVRYGEDDAQFLTDFEEQPHQRDGIGASGDSDGKAVARLKQAAAA